MPLKRSRRATFRGNIWNRGHPYQNRAIMAYEWFIFVMLRFFSRQMVNGTAPFRHARGCNEMNGLGDAQIRPYSHQVGAAVVTALAVLSWLAVAGVVRLFVG